VAVASNFTRAITAISQRFENSSGHKVKLIFGSTGKHYAQIHNGAPFDAFFAADSLRPQLLEQQGLAKAGSRFTYAIGKVVLWSPDKHYIDPQADILEQGTFYYLAIANPKLAPYGKAAMEILQKRGVWDRLRQRLVQGENIGQTYQFIKSGNAKLGFVAYSQIKQQDGMVNGSYWIAPKTMHTPIQQQALLLKEGRAARAFLAFVRSPEILKLIHDYGYDTP
jgi:molybdate transport system substrate-binding protein